MKYILHSDIFDKTLASKIAINTSDFTAGKLYKLDVIFHVKWLSDPRFQLDNPRTNNTLDKDCINEILNSKLDSIEEFFTSHGIKIMRSAIIGDKLESAEIVLIEISEMPTEVIPTKNGKNNTPLKVRSIIPSRPYINEVAIRTFAPIIFKEFEAEMRKSESL